MKLSGLLLGAGILAGATALTFWERSSELAIHARALRVRGEIEQARMTVAGKSNELAVVAREVNALESLVGSFHRASVENSETALVSSEITEVQLGMAGWDTGHSFIDLPKWAIKDLRIAPLNATNEITSEATALFGLTADERRAVQELYAVMEARVEQLEWEHFEPTDQHVPQAESQPEEKISFRVRAFPDEMELLKQQWQTSLESILGATRAELFSESIRRPPLLSAGLESWLDRSQEEHVTVLFKITSDGKTRRSFQTWRAGGGRGSAGGPGNYIAPRWQHLITEEMIEARRAAAR